MGTGEGGTPTKAPKTSPALQQEQPSTPSYTEWAAAFQAYYGAGATPPPPGYFPSTVASGPQPHPYMWGGQPMIPPYATPPPHATLYTYGGIYAHPPGAHPYGQYGLASPSTEMTVAVLPASAEAETKTSEGKDRNIMKKSRGSLGSLGMLTGKGSESAKGMSTTANGHTPSGESASDGSTEGSDDSAQNGSQHKETYEHGGVDGMEAYMNPAVGNPVNQGASIAVTGKPVAVGPTTNLNIGMDYWSGSSNAATAGAFPSPSASGKLSSKRNSSALIAASQHPHHLMGPTSTDLWLHDERELKRQRRKQSNRESARRSRLRKQAECEELTTRVDTLTLENVSLRTELNRLAEECKKLSQENATLLERVRKSQGREGQEERRSPEQDCGLQQKELETLFEPLSPDRGDDPCSPNNRSKEGSYRKNDAPSSRPESNIPHTDAVAAA